MIQTTHVGSLPYKNIDEAMEYTFKWDVPVLFTLPQLDKSQFLGSDVLNLLGIDFKWRDNQLHIPKDYFKSSKNIVPFYFEEFQKTCDKKHIELMKYQLSGPVTLYSLLGNKSEVSFSEFSAFLLERYSRCIEDLKKRRGVFFVLDEPLLRNNIDFYRKNEIDNLFQNSSDYFFIHCCDRLQMDEVSEILELLHLDLGLYQEDTIRLMKNCKFIGMEDFDLIKNLNSLYLRAPRFISPSCGLALKDVMELDQLIAKFQQFKKFLSLPNHQS